MARNHKIRIVSFVCLLCLSVLGSGCNIVINDAGERTQLTGARRASGTRLEHVALNVSDPIQMAQWYVDNLGMKIMREGPAPVNMRFLADSGGNMMLELYHNPPDAVPNYAAMDPLLLHVAFMVDDVEATRERLIAAGAAPVTDVMATPAGDILTMLRDPWGLAIQFLKRADPMLPPS